MVDENRRPAPVVQRDQLILITLANGGSKSLATLGTELTLPKNQVYGSLWRLRRSGYVQKHGVGSRTPEWQVTPEGATYAGQLQAAPVPAPAPEPAPV